MPHSSTQGTRTAYSRLFADSTPIADTLPSRCAQERMPGHQDRSLTCRWTAYDCIDNKRYREMTWHAELFGHRTSLSLTRPSFLLPPSPTCLRRRHRQTPMHEAHPPLSLSVSRALRRARFETRACSLVDGVWGGACPKQHPSFFSKEPVDAAQLIRLIACLRISSSQPALVKPSRGTRCSSNRMGGPLIRSAKGIFSVRRTYRALPSSMRVGVCKASRNPIRRVYSGSCAVRGVVVELVVCLICESEIAV